MLKKLCSLFALVFLTSTAQQVLAQSFFVQIFDTVDCQTGISQMNAWTLQGGTPPFTYLWNDGSVGQSLLNIVAGQVYSVTATDAGGQTATDMATARFSSGVPVTVSYTVVQNACAPNGLGGIVDVSVSGGTPPYRFSWGSGETTEDVSGLFGDTYLHVYDINNANCQQSTNINVGGGMNVYSPRIIDASCTMSNGSIALPAQGNYNYEWSDGQTTSMATGLAAGAYGVTVTDPANNCTVRRVFQLDNTPNCRSTISGYVYNNPSCQPVQNGYVLYQQVVITDNTSNQTYYPYTGANGYFQFNTTDATTYSLSITTYGGVAVICPNTNNYTVTTTAQGGNFANNDFFVGRANDVDVQVNLHSWGARPFAAQYNNIYFCNAGNLTQSGDITFTLDPLMTYGNSFVFAWYSNTYTAVTPAINGNVLTYAYSNLLSGECRTLEVQALMNSNQPIGTNLTNDVSITPLVGDAVPADNSDISVFQVINSYDPNDKQQFNFRLGNTFDGDIYAQDTEMDYLIRFQNTGNAPAIRVEVRDTFENALIAASVKNINTSHRANVRVEGNVLIATFDNIYLADSFSNEPASHGFISFKMNRQAGLPINTEINNSGAIYFDFNEPVITNSQMTTIVQQVAIAQSQAAQIGLNVMPNPAADVLNVQYQLNSNGNVTLNVVNGMGQIIKTISQNQMQAAGAQNTQIAVQDLPAGIYYIFVQTEKGNYAQKFVKQ